MRLFRAGDKVVRIKDHHMGMVMDDTDIVAEDQYDEYSSIKLTTFQGGHSASALKLLKEDKDMANATDLVLKQKLSADDYELYEAGVIDENNNLTSDGKTLLMTSVFQDKKADLLTLVRGDTATATQASSKKVVQ